MYCIVRYDAIITVLEVIDKTIIKILSIANISRVNLIENKDPVIGHTAEWGGVVQFFFYVSQLYHYV